MKNQYGSHESTYNTTGQARFKESAIIFFEHLEPLVKPKENVQPNIEELVDQIFKDRIEDGQLDKCPLFTNLSIREFYLHSAKYAAHSNQYPKSTSGGQNLS